MPPNIIFHLTEEELSEQLGPQDSQEKKTVMSSVECYMLLRDVMP